VDAAQNAEQEMASKKFHTFNSWLLSCGGLEVSPGAREVFRGGPKKYLYLKKF
jgi:hypothetical protein